MRAAIVVAAMLLALIPAHAEPLLLASCIIPTDAQKAMCEGDARKFCTDKFPNPFAVLACLKDHRAKLAPACSGLLASCGQ